MTCDNKNCHLWKDKKLKPSICTYLCHILPQIWSCWRKQWLSHPILTSPFYSLHLITSEIDFYFFLRSDVIHWSLFFCCQSCLCCQGFCMFQNLCAVFPLNIVYLPPLGIVIPFIQHVLHCKWHHWVCLNDTSIWCFMR